MPTANITLAITLDNYLMNVARPSAVVTFAFNTDVGNSFGIDDIWTGAGAGVGVGGLGWGGTWTNLTRTTGTNTWTATFTPNSHASIDRARFSVDLTKVTDASGNAGSGEGRSPDFQIDTSPPPVGIMIDKHNLKAGDTTIVTFNFGTEVRGFTTEDIISPGGTMSEPTKGYGTYIWTATFTPTAGITSANNRIDVHLSGVTDPAGNTLGNVYEESPGARSYSIDTQRPTVAIMLDSYNLKVGAASTTVTFTFSESVTGFGLDDIVRPADATLSSPINTTGNVWTATLSYPDGTPRTSAAIGVKLAGFTDAAGNAGSTDPNATTQSSNYTVDTAPPTVAITMSDPDLKAGDVATVTFLFSEDVGASFSLADVTSPGGQLANLQRDGTTNNWTALFTPTAKSTSANNAISVDLTRVTDAAGNAGTDTVHSPHYAIDTRRPTVAITLGSYNLKAGEATTVTFTFSEPVTGFAADDIDLLDANGTLGTLGPLLANADGRIWTALFTPTANVNDAANTIRVNLTGFTNAAGNAGAAQGQTDNQTTGQTSSQPYSINTVRPTVAIALADTVVKAGQNTTVTFTFSEPVTGLTADDIDLTDANGTLDWLEPNAGGRIWTARFTPTANVNDATNTIRVNLPGFTNAAGNTGDVVGQTNSPPYSINTVRPTVTIALANTVLKAGETSNVTFTFSEPVTGFTVDDIVLSDANGTLGTLASNDDGRTWTARFTPTEGVNDTANTIGVNLTGFTNAAGNAGAAQGQTNRQTDSQPYSINTVRPTVTIALTDLDLKAGETSTVTFTFSEPVTGFTVDDVVLTDANGRLDQFLANVDGRTWTALFTPTEGVNDTANTIGVNRTGFTNAAGNAGAAQGQPNNQTNSPSYSISTVRPTVTIAVADPDLKAGETCAVTFAFSEPVTGFTADDIVLSDANGTLDQLAPNADGRIWTARFTPTEGVNDTANTIRVNLTGFTNAAGNAGAALGQPNGQTNSPPYSISTIRPTVAITLADPVVRAGPNTTVTFTFSEPVTGFGMEDMVLTNANGTLDQLASNDGGRTWTARFTPTANVTDTVNTNTIGVTLSGFTNAAGNTGGVQGQTTNSQPYSINSARPTVAITLADPDLKAGEASAVTFAFNEPVTGFTADDIDLSDANGTLDQLASNDGGRTWTARFTPTANITDTANTIRVNLAGFTNAAGNTGGAQGQTSSSQPYSISTVRPTVTITLADPDLKAGETCAVTFAFSEPVTGFAADDVVLSDANGTLSGLTRIDALTWKATFTPTEGVTDTANTIGVNRTGFTNAAGNAGAAQGQPDNQTNSPSYSVSTVRPTVTIALTDLDLKAGETSTVTFTFSEPVTGFTADDIVLTDANGRLDQFLANADGRTWTALFTPTEGVTDTANTIRVNLTGFTNAAGNAGATQGQTDSQTNNQTSSQSYSISTVRPTVAIALADTDLKAGETSRVTFTFSEPVTGFTVDDIVLSDANGTLDWLEPNAGGRIWTARFTPTANITDTANTIGVNLTGFTNAAGNAGAAQGQPNSQTSSQPYSISTVRPTVTIALTDLDLKAGETSIVTFTFSEPVTGFTADDIVLTDANGTLDRLEPNAGGRIWTARFTPTEGVNDTANTIGVNLTGFTNAAGNAGAAQGQPDNQTNSQSYSISTVRPTVTIALTDLDLKAGETSTVTFTFSEPVTGFTADDIVLTDANGRLDQFLANVDGRTWTALFTPTEGVNDTANTIGVNRTGFTNAAGNAGAAQGQTNSPSYSINTVRPTVTIALTDLDLKADETSTVTFTFSEPVTGFTADDIVLSDANGTLDWLEPNAGGRVWTARFTPTANINDTANTIRVDLTGFTNAAGNAGAAQGQTDNPTSSQPYSVNTVRPTVTIALADLDLKAGETSTVTFTFSEPVTGFTVDDVVLTDANGALDQLASKDGGRTWTALFTPTANVNDTTNTILVNLAGFTNAAGNAGAAKGQANSPNYAIDTVRPDIAITLGDYNLTVGEDTVVTFVFTRDVGSSFDDGDITVQNGLLHGLARTLGTNTWTATFTPTANATSATNVISVDLAGVTDTAGNAGTGTIQSRNYTVDTRQPTVGITMSDTDLKAGDTATVTFTFSENVETSFTPEDVKSQSGALTDWAHTNGSNVWTATFRPADDSTSATNVISVYPPGVTDAAGNTLIAAAQSGNYSVDTRRPGLAIALAETTLKAGQTTTVTFTFTEDVGDSFSNDDITTVDNGTLGTVTRSAKDPNVWTATFTPTTQSVTDATNVIRVSLTGVTDLAGNAGTGTADSGNYIVDTEPPGVKITLSDTTAKIDGPITVTFTFTEDVGASFTVEDIVAPNGVLSAFARVGTSNVWTVVFTPNENTTSATNAISVRDKGGLAGVTDVAGNALGAAAQSANYIVDTRRPDVTITLDNYNLYAGETARVTFAFTEDVGESFSADDITLDNGALTNLVRTPDTNTWTATFTPTANITDATNVISVNRKTVTDTAGNAGAGQAQSDNYVLSASVRPPPPSPTPTSPLTPTLTAPAPRASSDRDRDSVSDAQEDESPGLPRPDGSAPVAGDGNGDGIRDGTQSRVASARVLLSPQGESNPADAASTFVTLVAGSQDGKLIPDSNTRITNLVQKDAPANLPRGLQMPIGLVDFKTALAPGRASETFSLYVDPALGVNGYWVKDTAGTWVNLASEAYGGKMVTEGGRMRLDFKIDDGGQFDRDAQVDGVITVPGAPASMQLSIVGQVPGAEHYGFWF